MSERAKAGGQRVVGKVVVQMVTEGGKEAITLGKQYQDIIKQINESSKFMVKASPMKQIALDSNLAMKVGSELADTQRKFNQALITSGGDVTKLSTTHLGYLKEADGLTKKLLAAAKHGAKQGHMTFEDPNMLKNLIAVNIETDKFNEALVQLDKDTGNFNEEFGKWSDIATDAKDKVMPGLISLSKDLWGGTIGAGIGESKEALDALTGGFKVAWSVSKGMFGFMKNTYKSLNKVKGSLITSMYKYAKAAKSPAISSYLSKLKKAPKALSGASGSTGKLSKATKGLTGSLKGAGGGISRMGPMLLKVGAAGPVAAAAIVATAIAFGALFVAFKLGMAGFKQLIDLQDTYRTSAFRSAGSINQLTDATLEAGRATGLGTKAAKEAMKSMVDVGLGADIAAGSIKGSNGEVLNQKQGLVQVNETIQKYSTITGVATQENARFIKSMTSLGLSLGDTDIMMAGIIDDQKRFGLSSKDVSRAIGTMTKMQSGFGTRFSKSPAIIRNFSKTLTTMYGEAKKAGVGLDVVDGMVKRFTEDIDGGALALVAFTGKVGEFMSTSDPSKMAKLGKEGISAFYDQVLKGKSAAVQAMIAKSFNVSNDQLKFARAAAGDMTAAQKKQYDADAAKNKINADFQKTTATFTMQLKTLLEPLMSMAAEAMKPFMENLQEIMTYAKAEVEPLWTAIKDLIGEVFGGGSINSKEGIMAIIKGMIEGAISFIGYGKMIWTIIKVIGVILLAQISPFLAILYITSKIIGGISSLFEAKKKLKKQSKSNHEEEMSDQKKLQRAKEESNKKEVKAKVKLKTVSRDTSAEILNWYKKRGRDLGAKKSSKTTIKGAALGMSADGINGAKKSSKATIKGAALGMKGVIGPVAKGALVSGKKATGVKNMKNRSAKDFLDAAQRPSTKSLDYMKDPRYVNMRKLLSRIDKENRTTRPRHAESSAIPTVKYTTGSKESGNDMSALIGEIRVTNTLLTKAHKANVEIAHVALQDMASDFREIKEKKPGVQPASGFQALGSSAIKWGGGASS